MAGRQADQGERLQLLGRDVRPRQQHVLRDAEDRRDHLPGARRAQPAQSDRPSQQRRMPGPVARQPPARIQEARQHGRGALAPLRAGPHDDDGTTDRRRDAVDRRPARMAGQRARALRRAARERAVEHRCVDRRCRWRRAGAGLPQGRGIPHRRAPGFGQIRGASRATHGGSSPRPASPIPACAARIAPSGCRPPRDRKTLRAAPRRGSAATGTRGAA